VDRIVDITLIVYRALSNETQTTVHIPVKLEV